MPGPYVTIGDTASHLGVSISTIRKWVREVRIPRNTYIKVGNTYRFDVAAVAAALSPVDIDASDLLDGQPTTHAPIPVHVFAEDLDEDI